MISLQIVYCCFMVCPDNGLIIPFSQITLGKDTASLDYSRREALLAPAFWSRCLLGEKGVRRLKCY